MTAKVILNPYSNRWNSQKRWPQAEAALKAAGVDFELVVSERKGHLVELAEGAVRDGFSPIIAAGGDGSIGDVANGLARAAKSEDEALGPLGIMPLGSANDLVYSLGLPVDLNAAAKVIAAGKTKAMDLGKVNDKYFVNNSGAGLEPYTTTKHERIHWIKGMARYLVAAVWAIMDKPEWRGKIVWDDDSYEGLLSLVSVGNGRRTGGFFMTPHADPFDGKLTLAFGYRGTRLGLLTALPKAFNEGEGSYIELEGMYEVHATRISIHLDKPSPAHTDGELFPEWIKDFEYEIFPKRLNMILP
ncbi:diacylglycerol kinase family lipid kinase [Chloroflexi bacterium CFX6]|nr:diacylglycerol kinase family lipid kinase [Chloroflexi bacterium CFX6]